MKRFTKIWERRLLFSFISLSLAACITPETRVSSQKVVKDKKAAAGPVIDRVLIANPIGLKGELAYLVNRQAKELFGANAVTSDMVGKLVAAYQPGRVPQNFQNLIAAGFQVEFMLWSKDYRLGRAHGHRLYNPVMRYSGQTNVPKDAQDVSELLSLTKGWGDDMRVIDTAIKTGRYETALKSRGASRAALMVAAKVAPFLLDKLGCTHMVVTRVDRTEAEYAKGVPVRVSLALIDIRTGRIVELSERLARKPDQKIAYERIVGSMIKEVFGSPRIKLLATASQKSNRLIATSESATGR